MRLRIALYMFTSSLLVACSSIDQSDRLIYVEPANVNRAVLIEEFTGQRCVNCPDAHEEIGRLQQQYGSENIVAVSIHSGPLAIFPSDRLTGLRTDLGDAYYDYWKVEAEPSGMVSRRGGLTLFPQWQALVYQELQRTSSLGLSLDCLLTPAGAIDVTVDVSALSAVEGRLQLWLMEDGIIAPQMMPDGLLNAEYVHDHVLRAAINGTWGEEVACSQGEAKSFHYTVTPDQSWQVRQLSVVAFVYDAAGVQQVCRQKVTMLE